LNLGFYKNKPQCHTKRRPQLTEAAPGVSSSCKTQLQLQRIVFTWYATSQPLQMLMEIQKGRCIALADLQLRLFPLPLKKCLLKFDHCLILLSYNKQKP